MRVATAVLVLTATAVLVIISLLITTHSKPGLPRTRPSRRARPGPRWDARTLAPAHRSNGYQDPGRPLSSPSLTK